MNAKRKLLEKLMRNGDIDGADKLASEICRACGADMSRGVSLSDVRKKLNATKRRMRRRTFAAVVLFMLVAAALTVGAAFFYGGDGVGDGGSEAMTASGDLPDDEGISLDVMRFYIGGEKKYGFVVTSSGLAFADGEIYDIDTSVISDLAAMIPFGSTDDTQTSKPDFTIPDHGIYDSVISIKVPTFSTRDDGRCYLIASGREGYGSAVWVYDGSYLEYFMRIFTNAKKQVSPLRLDGLSIVMNNRRVSGDTTYPAKTLVDFSYDSGVCMSLNGGNPIRCDGEVLRCLRQLFSTEVLCGEWKAPEYSFISSTIRNDTISVRYTSPSGDVLQTEIPDEKFTDGSPLYELAAAISSQLALKVRSVSALRSQYGAITQRVLVETLYTHVGVPGQGGMSDYERPDMLGVIYDGRLYADMIFASMFDGGRYPEFNTALAIASHIVLEIDGMENADIDCWIEDGHEYATRAQKLIDTVYREIEEGGGRIEGWDDRTENNRGVF
ncbi:MAG: hypothetical protein MRZ26_06250 [Ruminococcus sp.]|nr:hypothetical protein [Ruminococcus sp.]